MASVVTGGAAILAWDLFLNRPMGLNGIIIAVPLATVALVVFSLLFPKKAGVIDSAGNIDIEAA